MDDALITLQCPPARASWSYGPQSSGLTITDEAYWKTGPVAAGQWLLPSGRLITPYGLPPDGLHVPVGSALQDGPRWYCSREHQRLGRGGTGV